MRLRDEFGDDLRYSHQERSWYAWDGKRWAKDLDGAAVRCAKAALLKFADLALASGDEKVAQFARKSLDQSRILSSLASLQCELPIMVDQFDTHRHLLNFKNGTVDLRSGNIRSHRKTDFITKLIDHNYEPEAICTMFLSFLERITGGGPDAGEADNTISEQLMSYLQVVMGYSLTGETSSKVAFIAHGSGNNGKSTLLEVFRQIIPEYSAKILIDSLMQKSGGNDNTTLSDLSDLRGRRFVNSSETEYGQKLSEGRLKRITQGMGTIKTMRKYENAVEFPETHKLWIDANHLPVINGTENAIWNRLHPIPFRVVIPPEEIDRDLSSKLLREAPGILAWAVKGAGIWYAVGLSKPLVVEQAGNDWREEMDRIGPFLEEMCLLEPENKNSWVPVTEMYKAYADWATRNEEKYTLAQQAFSAQLKSHDIQSGKKDSGRVRVWVGIRFKNGSPVPAASAIRDRDT